MPKKQKEQTVLPALYDIQFVSPVRKAEIKSLMLTGRTKSVQPAEWIALAMDAAWLHEIHQLANGIAEISLLFGTKEMIDILSDKKAEDHDRIAAYKALRENTKLPKLSLKNPDRVSNETDEAIKQLQRVK